jgi:hypothetical protein
MWSGLFYIDTDFDTNRVRRYATKHARRTVRSDHHRFVEWEGAHRNVTFDLGQAADEAAFPVASGPRTS